MTLRKRNGRAAGEISGPVAFWSAAANSENAYRVSRPYRAGITLPNGGFRGPYRSGNGGRRMRTHRGILPGRGGNAGTRTGRRTGGGNDVRKGRGELGAVPGQRCPNPRLEPRDPDRAGADRAGGPVVGRTPGAGDRGGSGTDGPAGLGILGTRIPPVHRRGAAGRLPQRLGIHDP